MNTEPDNVTPLNRTSTASGGGGGNGNGALIQFRLVDLERRAEVLERKVDDVKDIVIRIETKMDGLAPKSYVLWFNGGIVALALLTIIGHLLIKSM